MTYDSVYRVLSAQKCSAFGSDGLPGIFYKQLAGALILPITIVFQQSINQNVWKLAHVTPSHNRKGDKTLPASYRPVSLIHVACKLLERLIVNQIRQNWAHHVLLCKEQYGFVPHRSTVSIQLQFDALVAGNLYNNLPCDVIMLDFSRAFDKVEHPILLNKLTIFYIDGCSIILDYRFSAQSLTINNV